VAAPLHANLRGAALFAGVTLGHLGLEDVAALVPVETRFEPDPVTGAVYDRLYAEFPALYSSQKEMFARLNGSRGS
jgi:xylulokinase